MACVISFGFGSLPAGIKESWRFFCSSLKFSPNSAIPSAIAFTQKSGASSLAIALVAPFRPALLVQ